MNFNLEIYSDKTSKRRYIENCCGKKKTKTLSQLCILLFRNFYLSFFSTVVAFSIKRGVFISFDFDANECIFQREVVDTVRSLAFFGNY